MTEDLNYPNLFILGVQKGGTSTLHKYLNESNEVFFPPKKELHYFDAYYHKGISWYLDHFNTAYDNKYKYAGEATPYYFFHPLAPKKIYNLFPHAKFIILLRNPIERAYSHYQMSVRRGIEKRSFEEAIKKEKVMIKGHHLWLIITNKFNPSHAETSYVSRGMYYKQLKRWLKYFSLEHFIFIKSEDLFLNPQQEIHKISKFLGISPIELKEAKMINQGNYDKTISQKVWNNLRKRFNADIKKLENVTSLRFNWF